MQDKNLKESLEFLKKYIVSAVESQFVGFSYHLDVYNEDLLDFYKDNLIENLQHTVDHIITDHCEDG